jgi:hypothetical protein
MRTTTGKRAKHVKPAFSTHTKNAPGARVVGSVSRGVTRPKLAKANVARVRLVDIKLMPDNQGFVNRAPQATAVQQQRPTRHALHALHVWQEPSERVVTKTASSVQ